MNHPLEPLLQLSRRIRKKNAFYVKGKANPNNQVREKQPGGMPWRISRRLGQHVKRDWLMQVRFDKRLHPLHCVDGFPTILALAHGYRISLNIPKGLTWIALIGRFSTLDFIGHFQPKLIYKSVLVLSPLDEPLYSGYSSPRQASRMACTERFISNENSALNFFR